MALYFARIELHNATWQDYQILHAAMAQQGFSQTIAADNGTRYALPPAEYVIYIDIDRNAVLERAKSAAATTGKNFSAVVIEAVGAAWYNLQKV